MKVLLLNTGRFLDGRSGIERVLCNMANELVVRGHEVEILYNEDKKGETPYPLHCSVRLVNVGQDFKPFSFFQKIKRELLFNKKKKYEYMANIRDHRIAKRLEPAIRDFQPDVIICYQVDGTRILYNNIKPNCPVITMFHGEPQVILVKCINNTIESLAKSARVQVLMNSFVAITKKYLHSSNVVAIPNAVPQPGDYSADISSKLVINVARVDKHHKRQHLLIEAFGRIRHEHSDWKLEIWGEADKHKKYYHYCQALIEKYGLQDRVKLCGTTEHIFEQLIRASIFAFPSSTEGFPLAMTEAMSIGMPAIGYKSCSTVNELIVDGHNGLLCDDGVDSLAAALRELMNDQEKRERYGKNAGEDMKEYVPQKVWDTWENLLYEVIDEYEKRPV